MRDAQPKTIYLKDYEAPAYLIDTTDLRVELGEDSTRVVARLQLRPNPLHAGHVPGPLVLDGQDMVLESLAIDGRPLGSAEYRVETESLSIFTPPQHAFVLNA